jgi:hypothetical protein
VLPIIVIEGQLRCVVPAAFTFQYRVCHRFVGW